MMFVKICGLTNLEDAEAAVAYGAQALGFVFYPKSPRVVEPDDLRRWIGRLPPHVQKVGVFVNEAPARVETLCGELGLDAAQLHGEETPAEHPRGVKVWKAFRVTPDWLPQHDYPADTLLLDGPGAGCTFDWSVCARLTRPFVLAGGLNEHNVRDAVHIAMPWGVDVSSGVEREPGRKDHKRMKDFMEAVTG